MQKQVWLILGASEGGNLHQTGTSENTDGKATKTCEHVELNLLKQLTDLSDNMAAVKKKKRSIDDPLEFIVIY